MSATMPFGANCPSHHSLLRAQSGPVLLAAAVTSLSWYWSSGITSRVTFTLFCAPLNSVARFCHVGSVASSCHSQYLMSTVPDEEEVVAVEEQPPMTNGAAAAAPTTS